MDGGDAAGVTQRLPIALTIAGSDSGGGAGIQADLKTFAAFGVYGASVVTALTAQNTRGVRAIHYPPPGIVGAQIEAVLEDFAVAAIKIGMLGSAEIADVVAESVSSPIRRGVRGEGWRASAPAPSAKTLIRPTRRPPSPRGRREASFHRLRPRHDRLLRRRAERRRLRRGDRSRAASARRLPDSQSRRGRGAARGADRAKRSGYGAPGRGALEAWPARCSDEGRTSGRRGGGGPSGDRSAMFAVSRRRSSLRRNLHGTGCTLSSAIAANVVLGMRLAGGGGVGQGVRARGDRAGPRIVTLGGGAGPLIQTELRSKL